MKINEIGNKYNLLTVVSHAGKRKWQNLWLCKCDCGGSIITTTAKLRNSHTSSCGCRAKNKFKDETGKTYGRLYVVEFYGKSEYRQSLFRCKCSCGNTVYVSGTDLRGGHTRSCGCLVKEALAAGLNTTHGKSSHRLFKVWIGMRERCRYEKHKDYKLYGGRGITVANEWEDFENFFNWSIGNGWKEGLVLDRVNNDLGYSPQNCRWTTQLVNAHNKGLRKNNTTGYEGVSFKCNRFHSRIGLTTEGSNRELYLGSYDTAEEAVIARDEFIIANNLPHKLQVLEREKK